MLKIWGRANSINVQKVLWCCGELGLRYERIDAGNQFGVTKTPEYRALNPNALVPTIEATMFWPALRPLFIELIRTPPANRDATVISRAETLSLAAAQMLDARLSDRTFLAGESFSFGDIPAATTVHRWYALDIHHPELPNLQRWYDLMKQRRPFQEVVMTPSS
jgi:glutathione S-transferase